MICPAVQAGPGPLEGLNHLPGKLPRFETFMQPVLRTFGDDAWRFYAESSRERGAMDRKLHDA
jgi:hypothetical protein